MTDRLPDPAIALTFPAATRSSAAADVELVAEHERSRAAALFADSDWAELGRHYDALAERAWKTTHRAEALRLLLAARAAAQRAGDSAALLDRTRFLAERYRLSAAFLAAEAWNMEQLSTPPEPANAKYHVTAWRARAALCEPSGDYESAVRFSDRSLAVAEQFEGAPGVAQARAQSLLQRATTERLRGHLETAYSFLDQARQRAQALRGKDDSPNLRGQIALAHARMDISVGHFPSAHAMYQEAESCFREAGSSVNVRVVRVARIAALRLLDRLPEALDLCRALVEECQQLRLHRIHGQVLLEQAEVLEAMGEGEKAARVLAQARPHFEGQRTLEAARWNRHMGRRSIMSGGDMGCAAAHLTAALGIAIREESRDLTRTWYALHDVLRLEGSAELPRSLHLLVSRTAVACADLQRDQLTRPENRWALQEQREEVYAGALMAHGAEQRHEDIAHIVELGRSDVLDHLLDNRDEVGRPPSPLSSPLPPRDDPERVEEIFRAARAVHAALVGDREPNPGCQAPVVPGRLPSSTETDELADVVVLVQIGKGPEGWWSSVVSRARHGVWHSSRQIAPPKLDKLMELLTAGKPLPAYGVSNSTWEALARFLLPHDIAWRGSVDRPLALLLSPDLRLWQLPYGALRRDGVCLLDVAEVTLTPSLRVQARLHRTRADADATAGSTDMRAISVLDSTLKGSADEFKALAAWPGSHEELSVLDPAEDLASAALLYLSGLGDTAGTTTLGPLGVTFDVLAGLRLPRLLILNGCWTGTAASRFGQDPLSLAVGGILGGAETVIAGIGHINSWSSAQVGAQILAPVSRGRTPSSALRQAQRTLRDTHPGLGPYDWAGMCLIGLGDRHLFRESTSSGPSPADPE
ncbi:CHAT domain-containing protein [Streptomyces ossamyceticus]|nr:CHAT domain-containing protein [Streptomyces ossamyceticus]